MSEIYNQIHLEYEQFSQTNKFSEAKTTRLTSNDLITTLQILLEEQILRADMVCAQGDFQDKLQQVASEITSYAQQLIEDMKAVSHTFKDESAALQKQIDALNQEKNENVNQKKMFEIQIQTLENDLGLS